MRAIPLVGHGIALRLLMDFPVEGLIMRGWIVEKEPAEALALIRAGLAEVVAPGSPPHPAQMAWWKGVGEGGL